MKNQTKDAIKAFTLIILATTTAILVLAGAGNESELLTALAAIIGVITYILAQRWMDDDRWKHYDRSPYNGGNRSE